jgi:conjugative transfer pilus assembly protein TraH
LSKYFQKRLFALYLAVSISPSIQAAGLQAEMDRLFNEMSNTTPPGIYESQRRGAFAGGRFTAKARIMNENLVALAPPSWKAGCGGVDLFGGSLSFVNADQIVQVLRAVAANAKGYAFQLALDNVFPDGAKWIENFQKKVQAMNQHLGNSCQLAQGLVNDLTSGFNIKHKTDASLKATGAGLYEDFFGSKQEPEGKSPMETLKHNAKEEYEKLIGNIAWKQLKRNSASTWFRYGDNTLLEAIMSLTGTVIIGDLIRDPASTNVEFKTNPIVTLPGNKITMEDLIAGGTIEIYACGSDTTNCLTAGESPGGVKTITIKGIRQQILDMLGTSSEPGIIFKYAHNMGSFTEPEKAFLSNLPTGIGAPIRNLSELSKNTTRLFVTESAGAIALAMIHHLTDELFRAAQFALANSESPYQKSALEVLAHSQSQVQSEYAALSSQYGDLSRQIERYNHIIENVRKLKTALAGGPASEEDKQERR